MSLINLIQKQREISLYAFPPDLKKVVGYDQIGIPYIGKPFNLATIQKQIIEEIKKEYESYKIDDPSSKGFGVGVRAPNHATTHNNAISRTVDFLDNTLKNI